MSARPHNRAGRGARRASPRGGPAPIFAALGDETRLALLTRLSRGSRCSIANLTAGSALTRQAVTKHLRVLQSAGLVRGTRSGRETLFELEPEPLGEARRALDAISRQWDEALARLKAFVEE
jgi:DNA-binding transcriptional ArsR family regulator